MWESEKWGLFIVISMKNENITLRRSTYRLFLLKQFSSSNSQKVFVFENYVLKEQKGKIRGGVILSIS